MGGSIPLNAVGLLNRRICDIDLFFSSFDSLTKNDFFSIKSNTMEFSETVTDVNGVLVQRVGTKINDVKCCVFKVIEEELQCSKFKFLGRTIKIQNVNFAIMAKMSYTNIQKRALVFCKESGSGDSDDIDKHKSDLKTITKTLDDLFVDDDGNIVW